MTRKDENSLGRHAYEPDDRTTTLGMASWEEFENEVRKFDDPTRKPWDEVWFRGQADAQWRLHTTLERRSRKIRVVATYLNVIAEIKSAIETFTGADFKMPTRAEVWQPSQHPGRGVFWFISARGQTRYVYLDIELS
jgi:hypothetical protein